MNKKLITLLISLTLILCSISSAGSEGTLIAPFEADCVEAVLAARIAETLEIAYRPEDGTTSEYERRVKAANLMLTQPEAILFDTQAALISSLQGYTTEDYRTVMVPVCRVARCPLYLVIGKEIAAEKGIDSAEVFLSYLTDNEYDDSLLLARHVDASPEDRATVFLTEELPLLTDVFFPDQIPDMLRSGDVALAIMTESEITATQDILILFALGSERTENYPDIPSITEFSFSACPEPAFYLMTKSGTSETVIRNAAQKISDGDFSSICLPAGFAFDPLSGDALDQEIAGIFSDYKDYMTAEGLYFYE